MQVHALDENTFIEVAQEVGLAAVSISTEDSAKVKTGRSYSVIKEPKID